LTTTFATDSGAIGLGDNDLNVMPLANIYRKTCVLTFNSDDYKYSAPGINCAGEAVLTSVSCMGKSRQLKEGICSLARRGKDGSFPCDSHESLLSLGKHPWIDVIWAICRP